jgi:CrcB protein
MLDDHGRFDNLDELAAPRPLEDSNEDDVRHRMYLENTRHDQQNGVLGGSHAAQSTSDTRLEDDYEDEGAFDNLDEVDDPVPIQNRGEQRTYTHTSLESRREEQQQAEKKRGKGHKWRVDTLEQGSSFATHLYTISYLIFFAIMGTLARVGLQALTFYPGAPIAFSELWANVGGTFIMGFLSEDKALFRQEWGRYDEGNRRVPRGIPRRNTQELREMDTETFNKRHATVKKTIPLYIGLAVGFCGSFTSFSSFIRDVFFALSNDLSSPISHPSSPTATTSTTVPRNGGYSFMAVLAVVFTTISLCMGALMAGAQLAEVLDPYTPTLPFKFTRRVFDPLFVVLAWGSWIGAIIMTIFPPDRLGGPANTSSTSSDLEEAWRGQILFALVFAPVGCLARFYMSLLLNARLSSFPLGTFTVNVLGTVILGIAYDLQHAPLSSAAGAVGGGVLGCQILQGVQDGFCGCLTTVSTWIAELKALRLAHSYCYGVVSVVFSLALLVVVMGSLRWRDGFAQKACQ